MIIVEGMAQQISDTCEEEGISYCGGYIVGDILGTKGLGKITKITKTKILNKTKVLDDTKGLTKNIIETGGLRNDVPLTKMQKDELFNYAKKLGIPEENIKFCGSDNNSPTGLIFDEVLNLNNDVLPAKIIKNYGTLGANSRISGKVTIAHEIIGHYESAKAGKAFQVWDENLKVIPKNLALDEAQASIRAVKFAPGLTSIERFTLLRDGIKRLNNEGINIRDVKDILFINKR